MTTSGPDPEQHELPPPASRPFGEEPTAVLPLGPAPAPPPYATSAPPPFPTPPAFSPPFPPPFPLPGAVTPRPAVPGWVWPLLVATAVVFGLLGGLLGGAVVLGTREGGLLGGSRPLAAGNDSVAAVAEKVLPSTVQVRVAGGDPGSQGATGSGFVVDRDGHVVTNNHVVEDAAEGSIVLIDVDGRPREAVVVGLSPVYDIAVLRVEDATGLRPALLGASRAMQVGETVVAVGSPLGLSSTVTAGIVSAVERPVTTGGEEESSYINAVQTDAAINPGNSGGPLVNLRGEVIGVNSAIATTGAAIGQSGNIGVGFAIPVEQARSTAEQIIETGQAEYPVIGANVETRPTVVGATVIDVGEDSPAAGAGIQEGDRIVAVDGRRVADGIALVVAIRSHRPGDTVELTVVSGSGADGRTVELRLDARVG